MIYSPLRYPGGKGKFAKFIKAVIEESHLTGCTYVEPFCGGSAVALTLLFEAYAKKVIINDYDRAIFAFWDSVLNRTDELCELIRNTRRTIQNWEKARVVHKNLNNYSNLELGFATFFLNRVNRSGILNAGVIGGKEQSGFWKMDVRYNSKDLIERIEAIAFMRDKIEIMNLDVIECLNVIQRRNFVKPFIYLDPPYYHKGPNLYLNYFDDDDHRRIANYIRAIDFSPWLVSYDDCDEIKQMYNFVDPVEYELSYSAGSIKYTGSELLFISDQIVLPSISTAQGSLF